jgi:hypothetical protein
MPDGRFRSGGTDEPLLRFIPAPQRDAVELAAWLGCSVADVAALRPGDVREDGIRVGRTIARWPAAMPQRLRDAVLALARATKPGIRLYEPAKPRIRAAFDLRSAMGEAIESAKIGRELAARRVAAKAPDFLGIGVPRSATTWLYSALSTHRDIYLPDKELEFFGDFLFQRGPNAYLQHFVARGSQSIAGDVSVDYFHSAEAPGRIAELLGKDRVKLIVTFREPIERAQSYYNIRVARGMAPATFDAAIEIPYFHDLFIARGHYARYLERWYETFDRNQLLVLLYEDIQTNPTAALAAVARFLGVSADGFAVPQRENAGVGIVAMPVHRMLLRRAADLEALLAGRPAPVGQWLAGNLRRIDARLCLRRGKRDSRAMRASTERRLQHEFAESNDRLARMTGLDLSAWRYPTA